MFRVTMMALLCGWVTARPPVDVTKTCSVGNASFPAEIFEAYAGWQCYEEAYRGMKLVTVRVCVEELQDNTSRSVPCFKADGKMFSFNLKNEESVEELLRRSGSDDINERMIKCFLALVAACEMSADGWIRFGNGTNLCRLDGQSKFHVALLSISMIFGIPASLIFFYCSWVTQNSALFHCRNLITALVMRTFFTLLIETEVVSKIITLGEEPLVNWAGCEALASFETITLTLVNAFWLILTLYLVEYSKTHFQKEPKIGKGVWIVLGFALTFPIIWIIIMAAGEYENCWLERTPVQWVNDSLRLGFILLQITLISIVVYRALVDTTVTDSTQKRLIGRMSYFTLALSPLFLIQFALDASHPFDTDNEEPQVYTEYFFDGLQCAIVSLVYIFLPEVREFLLEVLGVERRKKCHRVFETIGGTEAALTFGETARPQLPKMRSPKGSIDEGKKDVIYTSVLTPERFERTIKLYNRLKILPKYELPEKVEGSHRNNPDNSSIKSEYFDVDNDSINTVYNDITSHSPVPTRVAESSTTPRNRYYTSKYLIHDSDDSGSDEIVAETPKTALPVHALDPSTAIESWLGSCREEFQQYKEKAMKSKPTNTNTIHRSFSGNMLHPCKIRGTVKTNVTRKKPVRKISAPSLLLPEEKKPESLPSIYDDLKEYPRKKNEKRSRKRDYSSDWLSYRNRVLEKRRRIKSLDGLDLPEDDRRMSTQLKALLSPGYERQELQPGQLGFHFAPIEDLSRCSSDKIAEEKSQQHGSN